MKWGSLESLDSRFSYSHAEGQAYLASLTPDQALLYFKVECLDLLFLCFYSILFYRLLLRFAGPSSRLPLLALIPFGFDLLETTTLAFLLKPGVPGTPPATLPLWLPAVTTAKWLGVGVTLLVIAVLFVREILTRRSRLRSPGATGIQNRSEGDH